MTVYPNPGTEGSNVKYRERYDNYIGGDWVAPVDGEYFDNITPVTGEVFCQVARGKEADINLALDAAHKAAPAWGKTSPADRAMVLLKIADRMEEHLEELAVAETWGTARRCARRSPPTSRWPSITSATTRVRCARRKAA